MMTKGIKETDATWYSIAVRDNRGRESKLVLYQGIPVEEIKAVLRASFSLHGEPIGLHDEDKDIHFPIALLSKAPAYFAERTACKIIIGKDEQEPRKAMGESTDTRSTSLADSGPPLETLNHSGASPKEEEEHTNVSPKGEFGLRNTVDFLVVFSQIQPDRIIKIFKEYDTDQENGLDKDGFYRCILDLCAEVHPSYTFTAQDEELLEAMYCAFDKDGDGRINSVEFISGLLFMAEFDDGHCIQSAFKLYDTDGDGYITKNEMLRYFKAVFAVMYGLHPDLFDQHQIGVEEIALATLNNCFAEADTNQDGKLSFEEFREWYQRPSQDTLTNLFVKYKETSKNDLDGSNETDLKKEIPVEEFDMISNQLRETIKEFRCLVKFGDLDFQTVMSVLMRTIEEHSGTISYLPKFLFTKKLGSLLEDLTFQGDKPLLDCVYDAINESGSNEIAIKKLVLALSLLCGGSEVSKVKYIWTLYGSSQEKSRVYVDDMVNFFVDIFQFLKRLKRSFPSSVSNASDLFLSRMLDNKASMARALAEKSFEDMELVAGEEGMSLSLFEEWYTSSKTSPVINERHTFDPTEASNGADLQNITMEDVQYVTQLNLYAAEDVVDYLWQFVSDVNERTLPRASFIKCMFEMLGGAYEFYCQNMGISFDYAKSLMEDEGWHSYVEGVYNALFDVLEPDDKDYVSFDEMSLCLCVLFCGGSEEGKIRTVFALYDVDGDGFIDRDELRKYLKVLFRLCASFSSSPFHEMLELESVDPAEVANITTEKCFEEMDVNKDDRISFEEFRDWMNMINCAQYETGLEHAKSGGKTKLPSYRKILSDFSSLKTFDVKSLYSYLQRHSTGGVLDRTSFQRCLSNLISIPIEFMNQAPTLLEEALSKAFTMLSGVQSCLTCEELACGLALFCKGGFDGNLRPCFDLFDCDHDEFVKLDELYPCLQSVLKGLFHLAPPALKKSITNVLSLGEAQKVLNELLSGRNASTEVVSFEAFVDLIGRSITVEPTLSGGHLHPSFKGKGEERVDDKVHPSSGVSFDVSTLRKSTTQGYDIFSVDNLRSVVGLAHTSVYELEHELRKVASKRNGEYHLTKDNLFDCFYALRRKSGGGDDPETTNIILQIANSIHELFTLGTKKTALVRRITCGLSFLCAGDPMEKVRAAVEVLSLPHQGSYSPQSSVDENYINLSDVKEYLECVFTVVSALESDAETTTHSTVDSLASAMTKQIYKTFGSDDKKRIHMNDFLTWCLKSRKTPTIDGITLSHQTAKALARASSYLKELRLGMGLGDVLPSTMFETLLSRMEDDFSVDLETFSRTIFDLSPLDLKTSSDHRTVKLITYVFDVLRNGKREVKAPDEEPHHPRFDSFNSDEGYLDVATGPDAVEFFEASITLILLSGDSSKEGDAMNRAKALCQLLSASGAEFISGKLVAKMFTTMYRILYGLLWYLDNKTSDGDPPKFHALHKFILQSMVAAGSLMSIRTMTAIHKLDMERDPDASASVPPLFIHVKDLELWFQEDGYRYVYGDLPLISRNKQVVLEILCLPAIDQLIEEVLHLSDESGFITRFDLPYLAKVIQQQNGYGTVEEDIDNSINSTSAEGVSTLEIFLLGIFDILDERRLHRIQCEEWAAALSVVTGNGLSSTNSNFVYEDMLLNPVLNLMDTEKEGKVKWDDVLRYFTAAFKVYYALNPDDVTITVGKTPQSFAKSITMRLYEDNKISPGFKIPITAVNEWCKKMAERNIDHAANTEEDPYWGELRRKLRPSSIHKLSLLLPLKHLRIDEIIQRIYTPERRASHESFYKICWSTLSRKIPTLLGDSLSSEDGSTASVNVLMASLFVKEICRALTCDEDECNGLIPTADLCSALSVMCSSRLKEKASCLYKLYSLEGSAIISDKQFQRCIRSMMAVYYSSRQADRTDDDSVQWEEDLVGATADKLYESCSVQDRDSLEKEKFVELLVKFIIEISIEDEDQL